MRVLILLMIGWLSIGLGAVFLPLPTPFGIPLFLIGAGCILVVSPAARRRFKKWRASHRRESDTLTGFEGYLPDPIRKALDDTHPDVTQDDTPSKEHGTAK